MSGIVKIVWFKRVPAVFVAACGEQLPVIPRGCLGGGGLWFPVAAWVEWLLVVGCGCVI